MIKYYIRKKTGETSISLRYSSKNISDTTSVLPLKIEGENWDSKNQCFDVTKKKRSPKNKKDRDFNDYVDQFNFKLGEYKLNLQKMLLEKEFLTSAELKEFNNKFFNINKKEESKTRNDIPLLFSDFVEYYIRKHSTNENVGEKKPLTISTVMKYRVIKNRVSEFSSGLKITQIDDTFREQYSKWCKTKKYADNTIIKQLKFIKTFVSYAIKKGLPAKNDSINWKFTTPQKSYDYPTLSFEELKSIEETVLIYRLRETG